MMVMEFCESGTLGDFLRSVCNKSNVVEVHHNIIIEWRFVKFDVAGFGSPNCLWNDVSVKSIDNSRIAHIVCIYDFYPEIIGNNSVQIQHITLRSAAMQDFGHRTSRQKQVQCEMEST